MMGLILDFPKVESKLGLKIILSFLLINIRITTSQEDYLANNYQCNQNWIGDGECDRQNYFPSIQCGPYDGGDCGPKVELFGDGKCDEQNNFRQFQNFPYGSFDKEVESKKLDRDGFPLDVHMKYDGGDCTCTSSELYQQLFSLPNYNISVGTTEFDSWTIYPFDEVTCNSIHCVIDASKKYFPCSGLSGTRTTYTKKETVKYCGRGYHGFGFVLLKDTLSCSYDKVNGICGCQRHEFGHGKACFIDFADNGESACTSVDSPTSKIKSIGQLFKNKGGRRRG